MSVKLSTHNTVYKYSLIEPFTFGGLRYYCFLLTAPFTIQGRTYAAGYRGGYVTDMVELVDSVVLADTFVHTSQLRQSVVSGKVIGSAVSNSLLCTSQVWDSFISDSEVYTSLITKSDVASSYIKGTGFSQCVVKGTQSKHVYLTQSTLDSVELFNVKGTYPVQLTGPLNLRNTLLSPATVQPAQ